MAEEPLRHHEWLAIPPSSKTGLATVILDSVRMTRVTIHRAGGNLEGTFEEGKKKLARK
jgi:hypothetical protein